MYDLEIKRRHFRVLTAFYQFIDVPIYKTICPVTLTNPLPSLLIKKLATLREDTHKKVFILSGWKKCTKKI